MKRVLLTAACMLAFALAASAQAPQQISVYVGGALSLPSSPDGFKDAYNTGYHGLVGLGYKGILGIDFLISHDKKRIYPLECNPRFTGAFPMLSQLHLSEKIIPMDVFHMLEFLDWPYQMDCTSLNARYAEAVRGSHIIVFALRDAILRGGRQPEAGLYELDLEGKEIRFLEGATDYREFRNEAQFILTEGPPHPGESKAALRDPLHRVCRILFPYPIVDVHGGISASVAHVADWVHNQIFG